LVQTPTLTGTEEKKGPSGRALTGGPSKGFKIQNGKGAKKPCKTKKKKNGEEKKPKNLFVVAEPEQSSEKGGKGNSTV